MTGLLNDGDMELLKSVHATNIHSIQRLVFADMKLENMGADVTQGSKMASIEGAKLKLTSVINVPDLLDISSNSSTDNTSSADENYKIVPNAIETFYHNTIRLFIIRFSISCFQSTILSLDGIY
ncbi:unnamed protein product [Rodentolepis nana]|uniref:BspA family leucine-rich repeat surface protein n=1 Tax=Rodentolepis nana TaxID=102285 RepID=A0A0R3TPP9_RODNA|nr:unnamed protein product [Rodentolepis nana]